MATSVRELHGNLRNAYRNQWGEDMDPFVKRELEKMFSDFGPDRSESAVMNFIRSEQFFSVAKIRDYVPPKADGQKLYDDNCRDCMNGWREVEFQELTPAGKNKLLETYKSVEIAHQHSQVQRCHCWRGTGAN